MRVPTTIAAATGALLMALPLLALGGLPGATGPPGAGGLPAALVPVYRAAAARFHVPWSLLAAIHGQESDFGRSTAPGVRSGANRCGAAGPMQFGVVGVAPYDAAPHGCSAGGTWARYRDAAPHPGTSERPAACAPVPRMTGCVYDDRDAIFAAAAYLRDLGAGPTLDDRAWRAARAYNGAAAYADAVLARARSFEQDDLPAGVPDAVRGAIAAADAIADRPYALRHWPTHIDNPTYDCSSATSHVLWGAGVFGTAPWVSGELMRYGLPGRGRWITVYANPDHAFVVVAGRRFDTSRYDTGPHRGESGPRWRTGPRPTAGFAVRHPPGL